MSASEILEMIETVSLDDNAKLGEIDSAVGRYLYVKSIGGGVEIITTHPDHGSYTRSRDALKAIRPEGWKVAMYFGDSVYEACISDGPREFMSKQLPTEELAELHAIIQAIQYERK